MASVPPVDAPIATTVPAPVLYLFCLKLWLPTRFSFPTCTVDAIFIFVISSPLINSAICSAVIPDGLLTNSTAPADIASNTLSLNALITTVGSGYCGISFLKNSMPSIRGSSMSSVITSGSYFKMASLAS